MHLSRLHPAWPLSHSRTAADSWGRRSVWLPRAWEGSALASLSARRCRTLQPEWKSNVFTWRRRSCSQRYPLWCNYDFNIFTAVCLRGRRAWCTWTCTPPSRTPPSSLRTVPSPASLRRSGSKRRSDSVSPSFYSSRVWTGAYSLDTQKGLKINTDFRAESGSYSWRVDFHDSLPSLQK